MSLIRLRLAFAWGVMLAACSSSSTNEGGGGGGGSGGSGGGDLAARCEPACTAAVSKGCQNTGTKEGCLLTCKALTSASKCDATGNAYFDCAETHTVSCNPAGEPFVDGCSIEYLNAVNCAVSEQPNPDIVEPCAKLCGSVIKAACASTPSLDECKSNCLWAGATGVGCDSQWEAYLSCANNVTLACFVVAFAPGCGPLLNAYTKCVNAAS